MGARARAGRDFVRLRRRDRQKADDRLKKKGRRARGGGRKEGDGGKGRWTWGKLPERKIVPGLLGGGSRGALDEIREGADQRPELSLLSIGPQWLSEQRVEKPVAAFINV